MNQFANGSIQIFTYCYYGQNTGTTPDGRQAGKPFAPGANSSYGAATNGALADLMSTSKLPYEYATDGISNTFGLVPDSLGHDEDTRKTNLAQVVDGYMANKGMHLNLNILNREEIRDALIHPENHGDLVIRVSGYAVRVVDLSKAQIEDILLRTFHTTM